MKIYISAQTNVGLERTNNEDAFSFCPSLNKQDWDRNTHRFINNGNIGSLAVITDGMGGANAGEIASKIALETIQESFLPNQIEDLIHSENKICSFLETVIQNANEAIIKRIESDPDTIGMGTTIVLLWLIENKVYIAWCGDSRCYLFNPNTGLSCLTKDHSYIQELIDKGEVSVEDSFNHPDSNIITRCLGDTDTFTSPEVKVYDVHPNDTFILCSDGLCGYCKDKDIEGILYSNISDIDICNQSLIDLALNAGGYDNITVLLLSVVNDDKDKINIPTWTKLKKMIGL